MTPEAKFRDSEIYCSKFGDLSDTRCQVQGPPVNFTLFFLKHGVQEKAGKPTNLHYTTVTIYTTTDL
jgi:hypothetical protein